MPCVKWNDVKLTGLEIFKLNERLCNHFGQQDGFIVFKNSECGRVKRVTQFDFRHLLPTVPDINTSQYSPHHPSDTLAFTHALSMSDVFWIDEPENQNIAHELNSFLSTFFTVSEYTRSNASSPTLIFVLEFSYTPILNINCPSSWHRLNNEPDSVCYEEHEKVSNPLLMYPLDTTEETMFALELDTVQEDEDPEEDLLRQVRVYCEVPRPYFPRRVSRDLPAGLVKVGGPSLGMVVVEFPKYYCPVCSKEMVHRVDLVMRHKCGHFFHKDCAARRYPNCPLCRASSVTVL